jgi:integrase/recombinase XerD
MQINDKALDEVLQRLHNEVTKRAYLYQLRLYLAWTQKENYDELIKWTNEQVQQNLEDYCRYLQQEKHSKSYYNIVFSALTFFYQINFKLINRTRIRTMVKPNDDPIGGDRYTDEDIIKILQSVKITKKKNYKIHTKLRTKAIILLLASSGIRVGALAELKVSDLEKIEDCYSLKVYARTKYEHYTFLTPQASKVLDKFLEQRKNKWVDREYYSQFLPHKKFLTFNESLVFDMTLSAIELALNRVVRKANLQESKNGLRYEKPVNHAYRKRFNTVIKQNRDINPQIGEIFLGHKIINLDSAYLKISREDLFSEYKKTIPELTLDCDVLTM